MGINITGTETDFSHRLPNHNTVLQAEVRAIADRLIFLKANTRSTAVGVTTKAPVSTLIRKNKGICRLVT